MGGQLCIGAGVWAHYFLYWPETTRRGGSEVKLGAGEHTRKGTATSSPIPNLHLPCDPPSLPQNTLTPPLEGEVEAAGPQTTQRDGDRQQHRHKDREKGGYQKTGREPECRIKLKSIWRGNGKTSSRLPNNHLFI